MKHKHYAKRGLALLLCTVILLGVASGCAKNEQVEKLAVASTVDYRKDGAYTTTVALSGMSFKNNISAENLTLVTAASEEYATLKSEASAEGVTLAEVDESLVTSNVEITSVTRKDGNTIEVSFVDHNGENNVSGYYLTIAGKSIGEKEDATVNISVNIYKNITCDTENVTPDTKTVKLTMTMENDNFSSDIAKENITLAGSFEGMKIESISSANNNLTLQLTGDIAYNEASGCYTDGFVYIDKDGFENGYTDSSVRVGVNEVATMADSTTFAVKDGTASFDVKVCWDSFADKVSASDFTLDGASVTAFEKKDDTTGTLSITVDGKSSANEIADAIFGKTLTIAGDALTCGKELVTTVGIAQASFYPVFDYAEENDGTYTITLILYAESGTFASKLSDDQVSFSDDFADAEISSLTRDSDTTATLVLTTDSGGATVEDMDLYGTVVLSKGALLNEWGENAEEKAYSRNYNYAEMGKLQILSAETVEALKAMWETTDWTTLTKLGSAASAGASVIQGIWLIAEWSGWVESEKAKLDKIYDYLVDMRAEFTAAFARIEETLSEQTIILLSNNVSQFEGYLKDLDAYLADCEDRVSKGTKRYNEIYRAPEALTFDESGKCTSSDALVQEWTNYYQGCLTYIRENYNPYNAYSDKIAEIEKLLVKIDGRLSPMTPVRGALGDFDTLCSKIYNFDAQSLYLRQNYRTVILGYLIRAKATLTTFYMSAEPGSTMESAFETSFGNDIKYINNCYSALSNNPAEGLAKDSEGNETMYMYATGKYYLNKVYTLDNPMKMSWVTFATTVANLVNEEYQKTDFLRRMQGRTLRQELLLLGDDIGLNPILLDNRYTTATEKGYSINMCWFPYSFCTTGFITDVSQETAKGRQTEYGQYAGYSNTTYFSHVNWNKESDKEDFIKDYKEGDPPGAAAEFNYAVDADHYFDYVLYYLVAAK